MTTQHGFVICFALGVVAACSMRPECQAMMPQLATLAGSAIGGVLGNAMAESRNNVPKKPNNKKKGK
jgi:hypothetical protein